MSHTSNFNSATLRFEIVEYVDSGWDGACAFFDSNNNNFSPDSTPGDWSYSRMFLNAYYTNNSTYTSTIIKGIAGHEIGHAFGLDDLRYSWDYYKLMWYKTGEYRSSGITTDEIDWIRIIYSN